MKARTKLHRPLPPQNTTPSYLFDSLNVPNLAISSGDEHRLRALSDAELQAILDTVRGAVESLASKAASIDTTAKTVTFTNGRNIAYPTWMLDMRGHDLLPLYQNCYGGGAVINPAQLGKSLRRVRLIPTELADLMRRLQS